jgi:hypothetical protein
MSESKIEKFRTAAAAQEIPGAEVDAFLETVRFYAHLTVAGTPTLTAGNPVAGRKGGLPHLPADVEWPVGPSGPLRFQVAIDCAALPQDEELDIRLPVDGRFLFFVDWENTMLEGAEFETEQQACRAIYVPGGVPVQERPVPVVDGEPAFEPFPPVDVHLVVLADTPDAPESSYQLEALSHSLWQGGSGDRDVRVGGYALAPQGRPTDLLAEREAEAIEGADLEKLRIEAEREWVPLAQFEIEDDTMDATVARFLVKRADLAAGDFSGVVSYLEFME